MNLLRRTVLSQGISALEKKKKEKKEKRKKHTMLMIMASIR